MDAESELILEKDQKIERLEATIDELKADRAKVMLALNSIHRILSQLFTEMKKGQGQ